MAPLKNQYEAVKDPLVNVAAKIPASVQRVVKQASEDLNITTSMLIRLALEQYLDGIKHADLSLKFELMADGISNKASAITEQNIKLLEYHADIKLLLKELLDDNADFESRSSAEVNNMIVTNSGFEEGLASGQRGAK